MGWDVLNIVCNEAGSSPCWKAQQGAEYSSGGTSCKQQVAAATAAPELRQQHQQAGRSGSSESSISISRQLTFVPAAAVRSMDEGPGRERREGKQAWSGRPRCQQALVRATGLAQLGTGYPSWPAELCCACCALLRLLWSLASPDDLAHADVEHKRLQAGRSM